MKHYKSVEILSIFRMPTPRTNLKPPAETQSHPIENFLATVLIQLYIIHMICGVSMQMAPKAKFICTPFHNNFNIRYRHNFYE